jgi:hypothetical protein
MANRLEIRLKNLGMDRKFRLARVWSNDELRRFASLFRGDVINVSGWRDYDREGGRYRDYFVNARSYSISNYSSQHGVQGLPEEIQIDLTAKLPTDLKESFDVVFNHTTLEHVYEVETAFDNLCALSRDVVIVVAPFVQQMHFRDYGDYWRFTPMALQRMLTDRGLHLLYLSFNSHRSASVYVFAIGSRHPERWRDSITGLNDYHGRRDRLGGAFSDYAGARAIPNSTTYKLLYALRAARRLLARQRRPSARSARVKDVQDALE